MIASSILTEADEQVSVERCHFRVRDMMHLLSERQTGNKGLSLFGISVS